MVDMLNRNLAPVTAEAWGQIEDIAQRRLKAFLTARRVVDVVGPDGWGTAAVNLGRTSAFERTSNDAILWANRQVQPLIEVRAPFRLQRSELDAAARGAKDIELQPLERAARAMARFEDSAIYHGFEAGGIRGISALTPHPSIALREHVNDYPRAIADAARLLVEAGFPPPLTLILGPEPWAALMQSGAVGYPPQKIIRSLIGGDILASGVLRGGLLFSASEGHFELTLGQDLDIGYENHDGEGVDLFLVESFAFRVLEPAAAVRLDPTD